MGRQRVFCGCFVLIGSMNPCPCGYWGDPVKECTCSSSAVTRYQKRISGPLLDRIDTLRDIEVPRVEYEKLADERMGESSAATSAANGCRPPTSGRWSASGEPA